MIALVEKIIASPFEMEGTVPVNCAQCGREHYVVKECVERDGRINAGSLFGAFLSKEGYLYCNIKCWADFCAD